MKLKHPESKQTVEARDEYVEAYRSQGWVEVKAQPKPPVEKQPTK